MISPRLARLRKAAFVASPLCLPVAATAPKPETLIFYSLRGKLCAAPGTEKFFLLFLSWKSLRRVGDSSSSSSSQGGTALGGTVAVVSPALSRPSPPANESSSAGRGGWSPGERTSAALPLPPSSPFQGKMESCFRPLHQQHQSLPRKRPRIITLQQRWLLLQFCWR